MITGYRVDYITKSGERGIWEYESDITLDEVKAYLVESLKYAKGKMPEIDRLVLVEISEKDIASQC
jgi:hypothetical protein